MLAATFLAIAGLQTCKEVKELYQGQHCCQDPHKMLNMTNLVDDIQAYKQSKSVSSYEDFSSEAEMAAFKMYAETMGRLPTASEVEDVVSRDIWYQKYQELLTSDAYLETRGLPTDTDLTGRVFAISGMSGGFGFSTAVLLAQRGAKVHGFSRTELVWTKVVESAQRASYTHPMPWPTYTGPVGVSPEAIARMSWSKVDAKNRTAVLAFFDELSATEGRLDGVFITHGTDLRDTPSLDYVPSDTETELARYVDRFSISPSKPAPDLYHDHVFGYWNVMAGADGVMKATDDSLRTVVLLSSVAGLQTTRGNPNSYHQVKNHNYNVMSFQIEKLGYSVSTVHPILCVTDSVANALFETPNFAMDWAKRITVDESGEVTLTLSETTKSLVPSLLPDFTFEVHAGIKDWQKLLLYAPKMWQLFATTLGISVPNDPVPLESGARTPISIAQHAAYALADPSVKHTAFVQYYPELDNGHPAYLPDQLFFLDRETVGALNKRVHTALVLGNGAELEDSGLARQKNFVYF